MLMLEWGKVWRESQLDQVGVAHASDLPLRECLHPVLAASWCWAT